VQLAIVLAAAVAIVLRAPVLLLHPRLWAEEGIVYFAFAHAHGLWTDLTTSQLGYYSLVDNLAAALAAKAVPLERAPLVTTLVALLAQLLPFVLILRSKSTRWPNLRTKVLACIAVLVVPPSGEIWLNSINSQFFLCVVTFLLLLEPVDRPEPLRIALLLVSGFSGVVSCYLTPLFLWKARRDKTLGARVEALTMTAATVIEAAIVFYHRAGPSGAAQRLALPTVNTILAILVSKTVVLPLAGGHVDDHFAFWTLAALPRQSLVIRAELMVILAAILLPALALALGHSRSRWTYLAAYGLLAVGSIVTSLERDKSSFVHNVGGRYFYAPNAIVALGLAEGAAAALSLRIGRGFWLAALRLVVLLEAIVVSLAVYRATAIARPSWPDWATEVRAWRADPTHRLRVWPGNAVWDFPLER
jgi:hypothetical protein